ncbi:MAG: hypothetical protein K2N94_14980, partial [Lachnospiraceae bacterium]|nr:hypothetical protein [Lachnospiraceae bacterium]
DLKNCRNAMEEAGRETELALRQFGEAEEKLQATERLERETRLALQQAEGNLAKMDCARAIEMARLRLQQAQEEKEKLERQERELSDFQTRISELLAWFFDEKAPVEQKEILSALTGTEYTAAEKAGAVSRLLDRLNERRDGFVS